MFLQTFPHAFVSCSLSTSSVSPSLVSHAALHFNNTAAVLQHQLHSKGVKAFGAFGGLEGDHSRARKEIGLKVTVIKSSRNTKKGLKRRFDDAPRVIRGVGCCATLQEEDLSKKAQQESSGSGAVVSHPAAVSSMEGKSLWRKLAQNVNLSGVSFSARVIVKDRHLAIPHVSVPDISWIDWKALRIRGFEGVLFDKDNTLTAPYGQKVWPTLTDSLEECREVFGGRIALLSNSAGLYQYDPSGAEATILENTLGIPVIRHDAILERLSAFEMCSKNAKEDQDFLKSAGQKKPAGNALALSNYFGCDPTTLIMVGDRYFTDVVYGNSNGLLTIRSAPLTTRGEPFVVKRVRGLEDTLVDWWRRQGCLPPKHKLFDNPVEFIKDPGCW